MWAGGRSWSLTGVPRDQVHVAAQVVAPQQRCQLPCLRRPLAHAISRKKLASVLPCLELLDCQLWSATSKPPSSASEQ